MSLHAVANKRRDFVTNTFLITLRERRKIVSLQEKQTVFGQGGTVNAVFYI
jgi:hypothetical protein